MESGESRGREVRYHTSICMRKDDSRLEDELEYFWDAPIPSSSDEQEEDRWWSPGPQEPSSEEDEEEVRNLTNLLGLEAKKDDVEGRAPPPLDKGAPGPSKNDCQTTPGESAEEGRGSAKAPEGVEQPPKKRLRRWRLRKKVIGDEGQKWETARRDAWLRELLTDSSGSESEDKCIAGSCIGYIRLPQSQKTMYIC
jgi:hypothetical protein